MNKKEIVIRKAVGKDVPLMVNLLTELFSIESDFTPAPKKQSRGLNLLLARSGAMCFVACNGDNVVGMITCQMLISTAEGGTVGLVEDIIVAKEYRRMGVGEKLIKSMERWGSSMEMFRLQLLVDLDNTSAASFYKNSGWNETRMGAWRNILY